MVKLPRDAILQFFYYLMLTYDVSELISCKQTNKLLLDSPLPSFNVEAICRVKDVVEALN